MTSGILTNEMKSAYLARIGVSDEIAVCKSSLDEIVYRHQCSVPFETADLHYLNEVPVLDIDAMFQKIVVDRHGGYCFELNKMLELLLCACGFKARPCLSRAVRGREGRMPINHRGLLVELDGQTLSVDVGFGGPLPAGSLVLEHECEQVVRGEIYITRQIDEHWWAIDRISQAKADLYGDHGPSRRQTELELCLAAVEDIDFVALNGAFSGEGTVFRDGVIANIRTENGFIGIRDKVLNVREFGESVKIPLETDEEICDALEKYYGFRPYGK